MFEIYEFYSTLVFFVHSFHFFYSEIILSSQLCPLPNFEFLVLADTIPTLITVHHISFPNVTAGKKQGENERGDWSSQVEWANQESCCCFTQE